jgi:hypothetical protein
MTSRFPARPRKQRLGITEKECQMPGNAARPILFLCALLLLPHGLFGQGLPAGADMIFIESGTPVKLQMTRTISSAHAHKGDRLDFVAVDDVVVKGFTVIHAGAPATGSILEVRRKRPLGIGGAVLIRLDSVELSTGERSPLIGRKKFKGRSHAIRMGVRVAVLAAIYLPAASLFLLSRGQDSTVLKGAEVTAYTRDDSELQAADLPLAREHGSELGEMMQVLPARALNGEGREGDMLNLMFAAKEDDLQKAFAQSGWLKVETSIPQIVWHLLWQRNHYTKLPMDRLYVFGREQDYSYALPDPTSIVGRRHHLRIWKTDRIINGVPIWVGAATHDVSIQFVKRKLQLLHRIDPNVDAERDFIAQNLAITTPLETKEYLRCDAPVFKARTATGQEYYSDSRMLLVQLTLPALPVAAATELAQKLQ